MCKRIIVLLILFFCLLLNACYNKYEQELIVVSKTPRGAYVGEKVPPGHDLAWYEIGLSRNGKEPIEYIWYARESPYDAAIMNAEIGERGTAYIHLEAKLAKRKLPRPNAKKPPTIGIWGEVFWEKAEPASDIEKRYFSDDLSDVWINSVKNLNDQDLDIVRYTPEYMIYGGKKYLIIRPYVIMDEETGEEIDFRTTDRIKRRLIQ